MFLLGFILYGALCASWTWLTIFVSMLGKFSTITSSKFFSYPFFFFFFWDPYNSNVGVFVIVPEVSETILRSFHSFHIFSSSEVISTFYLPVHWFVGASLVAQRLKRLPAMRETQVWSLGREDPLEKEMATHSSILAWRIPWREEPGRLQSTGLQRLSYFTSPSHLTHVYTDSSFTFPRDPQTVT